MNKSESIIKLAIALNGFNSEVHKIGKNASNPFFKNKYATLDNIIDDVRPLLQKHGLSILQMPSGDGEKVALTTLLIHESGEYIESQELIMKPVKNDPQAVGSCITYARRYSLVSFLSLNTGEDDDGNKASGNIDKIDKTKIKTLTTLTTKKGKTIDIILKSCKVGKVEDISTENFIKAMAYLEGLPDVSA